MRVVFSDSSLDPYFNLASEQYMLEGYGDVFMLWRNGKSVIIGKNQNAYSEVNIPFCEKNKIRVARRLTGGGAVFHDEGNVNFSFITDSDGRGINFKRFLAPVADALADFGINAEINGRNDLVCDGFNISGNAQCVYTAPGGRKRLLHHGTLLFSADVAKMSGSLNVSREKLEAKGIKSVSSRVKNISLFKSYSGPADPSGFADGVCSFAEKKFGTARNGVSESEKADISRIAEEKFATWEWIYGKSNACTDTVRRRFGYGTVEIGFTALHGVIEKIKIYGDFFGERDISGLETALSGCRLVREDLEKACADAGRFIHGASPEDIAGLIIGSGC